MAARPRQACSLSLWATKPDSQSHSVGPGKGDCLCIRPRSGTKGLDFLWEDLPKGRNTELSGTCLVIFPKYYSNQRHREKPVRKSKSPSSFNAVIEKMSSPLTLLENIIRKFWKYFSRNKNINANSPSPIKGSSVLSRLCLVSACFYARLRASFSLSMNSHVLVIFWKWLRSLKNSTFKNLGEKHKNSRIIKHILCLTLTF